MRKSHVGVQTDLAKKEKKKKYLRKNRIFPSQFVEVRSTSMSVFRITGCIMSTSRVVVRFSRDCLANLRAAILGHAERLQALLRPSWLDAGEIQDEIYCLVDTLMLDGVDQKWFSGYALVEGAEVMLMTPEIHVIGLGFLFERLR
jgi:hypothetical protein